MKACDTEGSGSFPEHLEGKELPCAAMKPAGGAGEAEDQHFGINLFEPYRCSRRKVPLSPHFADEAAAAPSPVSRGRAAMGWG